MMIGSTATQRSHRLEVVLAILQVSLCLAMFLPSDGLAKAKPQRAPRPEPEIKIVELTIAPTPYSPENGPLEFSVTVRLPRELNGATILEVSSLISSPSKTSIRFLSSREPVQVTVPNGGGAAPPTLSVRLLWDGQDHRKQPAGAGTYSYEVATKLLMDGEKGPRTMMVAWPKRGKFVVK
jgi:hypothetical protein